MQAINELDPRLQLAVDMRISGLDIMHGELKVLLLEAERELEEAQQIEGMDPCQHIVRVYEDDEMKAAVEAYYQPYKWRKDPAEETDPRDK